MAQGGAGLSGPGKGLNLSTMTEHTYITGAGAEFVSAEIAHYSARARATGADFAEFTDLEYGTILQEWGESKQPTKSPSAALHARQRTVEILSGFPAHFC